MGVRHRDYGVYTHLGGSWPNMTESMQRILKRRVLESQHPEKPEQIIEWLEAAARGWDRDQTPFECSYQRDGPVTSGYGDPGL
jgi:hypothetical protein